MQVRNRGAAVLLVSEDLDELFEQADRMVVIKQRRLEESSADIVTADALGKFDYFIKINQVVAKYA
jgi:simple sugar transport system ATP-binding protein